METTDQKPHSFGFKILLVFLLVFLPFFAIPIMIWKKVFPVWFRVVGACWMVIVLIALFSDKKTNESHSSQSKKESLKPVERIDIMANDLYEIYRSNELAGDNKFKGKIVTVKGTITAIGKDIIDQPYVSLQGDSIGMFGVQCFIKSSEVNRAMNLEKGQYMFLKGKVKGLMGSVILEDCLIAPAN